MGSTPQRPAEPGLLARRSTAFLTQALALEPSQAAAHVVEHEREARGALLGRDWLSLVEHVRRDGGPCPAPLAWRAGHALHHLGHLTMTLAVVAAADPDDGTPADRARLAAVAAAAEWSRGDRERCRVLVEEAFGHARRAADPGAEAWAWVVRALLAASDGDRDLNLTCYERSLALAEQAGDTTTQERVLNNLGSRSLEEGRNAEALVHLQHGLVVNEETGHLSSLAVLRHNCAEALLGLGRIDEALVECDAARALWTSLEAPSVCVSWALRGEIQVARGNLTQAAQSYAHAAELAALEDDAQTRAAALAGHASALVGTDPQRAVALAEQALALELPVGHAIPVVAAGWVRLATGDTTGACELAERAVELAGRHRDLPRLADALELAALADPGGRAAEPRLREATSIWRELGHPVRLLVNEIVVAHHDRDRLAFEVGCDELRSLGVHDDAWRIAGPLHAVGTTLERSDDVRVHVLGSFGVELGGVPVPGSQWPSRKTREVLKVLALRGSRGIGRDRLGALIWPDADSVGNRLSVALSHLRSVLDPGRLHPADHYVVADAGSVRLDLQHVEVDFAVFVAAARAALAAARAGSPRATPLLESAAAMHGGELLEDDGDLEWAVVEREEVETLGRDVLRTLAALAAAGDDPADALPWLSRLLAVDPYDEAAYTDLVGLLCRFGRYGEARRHHRAYRLRMAELGVPALTWAELVGPGQEAQIEPGGAGRLRAAP